MFVLHRGGEITCYPLDSDVPNLLFAFLDWSARPCVPNPLSREGGATEGGRTLGVFVLLFVETASRFVLLSVLYRLCDPYKVLLVTRGETFDLIKVTFICLLFNKMCCFHRIFKSLCASETVCR